MSEDEIVERVKQKYDVRSEAGIALYHTTLADNDAAEIDPDYWLKQAQFEAMDFVLYAEKELVTRAQRRDEMLHVAAELRSQERPRAHLSLLMRIRYGWSLLRHG